MIEIVMVEFSCEYLYRIGREIRFFSRIVGKNARAGRPKCSFSSCYSVFLSATFLCEATLCGAKQPSVFDRGSMQYLIH